MAQKREYIYHAAMLDPHTTAELPIDKIVALCDDLIEAHGSWLPKNIEDPWTPEKIIKAQTYDR